MGTFACVRVECIHIVMHIQTLYQLDSSYIREEKVLDMRGVQRVVKIMFGCMTELGNRVRVDCNQAV